MFEDDNSEVTTVTLDQATKTTAESGVWATAQSLMQKLTGNGPKKEGEGSLLKRFSKGFSPREVGQKMSACLQEVLDMVPRSLNQPSEEELQKAGSAA
jgi:hypothetical protein